MTNETNIIDILKRIEALLRLHLYLHDVDRNGRRSFLRDVSETDFPPYKEMGRKIAEDLGIARYYDEFIDLKALQELEKQRQQETEEWNKRVEQLKAESAPPQAAKPRWRWLPWKSRRPG